jgi:hypothetical protein
LKANLKVDVIVISDGRKFLDAASARGPIAETMRATDIAWLETSALRPIEMSNDLPKIMLSSMSIFARGPDAIIYGMGFAPK